ncbi:MAG TPA: hypothetical protein VNG12_00490 [Acidimicrobiales bacterium]|nr:hypothetical protein [Acidimicrobiales bacterium]
MPMVPPSASELAARTAPSLVIVVDARTRAKGESLRVVVRATTTVFHAGVRL